MAWKARVAGKTLEQQSGQLILDLDFFDDADAALVIVRRRLAVQASLTLAEIGTLVRAEGARERAKHADLKALDARIEVGTEITI